MFVSLIVRQTWATADESLPQVSFTRDVVPALTKSGCNAGNCHGSFQGQRGFRLSLLGFDPAADFDALVKEGRGRRVLVAAPQHSLLLRKPTGQLPHGGGVVLDPQSATLEILRQWIQAGCPGPAADPATVTGLQVSASELVLQKQESASLQIVAISSDGAKRDVTPWALYDCSDKDIGVVNPVGQITANACGRTAITIRYGGQVAAVGLTVPYARIENFPDIPRNNFIDDLAGEQWKQIGVVPAPLCDDATFLRRVSLDLIGTLPTPDEIRAFVASHDPEKRNAAIDNLLERPEYVEFWSWRWSDLLRAHRRFLGDKGLASFQSWLHAEFRANQPADAIVRQLLTAQGNLYSSGPVAFYFVAQKPEELAETTAQIFLGVRMQCARCHHHPFEVWSQEDYYGLCAFFARVKRKDTKEGGRFGGAQAVLLGETGSVTHPLTGQVIPPRLLGGQALTLDEQIDPRQLLADWIVSRDNPFFAKNFANRYWGYLFGRGLVQPIDDLRDTNPASHPALLDALSRDFAEHGYDLKHLLRTICRSRVYQLAAEISPQRDEKGVLLTHQSPRQLSAEVLLDAVNQVTGMQEKFQNLPPGQRAISLPDSAVVSEFLDIFGRAERNTTCLCERKSEPDLRQALHLMNNEELNKKISAQDGWIVRLLAAHNSDQSVVEEIYLAALARMPDDHELESIGKFLAEGTSRQECFEDLLWTLFNSAEFSFSR